MSIQRRLDFLFGVPLIKFLAIFSRTRRLKEGGLRKVLVIKLAAVGDTALLLGVIHSYHLIHPDTEIHWLVSPINRVIAGRLEVVDRFHIWKGFSFVHLLTLVRQLRAERYDVVYDLEQWSRGTALIAYFTGSLYRIGFKTTGQIRHGLYTEYIEKKFSQHEIDDFYDVMSVPLSLDHSRSIPLTVPEDGRAELGRIAPFLLNSVHPIVVLHPGCGSDGLPREWPVERYATIGKWLIEEYGARIVVTSGPEEVEKAARLSDLLGHDSINLGGRLSWNGVLALLERIAMLISGNTGIMHLAAALRKKQIALHGPTNPKLWGPLNPEARTIQSNCPDCPCLRLGFEYHALDGSCMQRIQVDDVKRVIREILR